MSNGTVTGNDGFLRAAAGKTLAETPKIQALARQSESVLRSLLDHRAHILESIAHAVHENVEDPAYPTPMKVTVKTPDLDARLTLVPEKNEIEIWIHDLPQQPWLRSSLEHASKEDWPALQRGLHAATDKLNDELLGAFGARPKSLSSVYSGIVVRFDVPGLKEALASGSVRV